MIDNIRDHVQVWLLLGYLKLRWWWFHISPSYVKFSMSESDFHFQNIKTGVIHSQIEVNFHKDSVYYKDKS